MEMQIHAVEKEVLMMDPAGYTLYNNTPAAHYNRVQQGSRASLIVNQELFHCNSCTL